MVVPVFFVVIDHKMVAIRDYVEAGIADLFYPQEYFLVQYA